MEALVEILEFNLRKLVRDAKLEHKCSLWKVRREDIKYGQVISKEESSTLYLVRFVANPENAYFETRVRFDERSGYELAGQMIRIAYYGKQSWCVGHETEDDKYMKQFCVCK